MSDRIAGLTVVFKKPMKDEDAEEFRKALCLFVGVAEVKMHVITVDYYFQAAQVRSEFRDKILDIILESK